MNLTKKRVKSFAHFLTGRLSLLKRQLEKSFPVRTAAHNKKKDNKLGFVCRKQLYLGN